MKTPNLFPKPAPTMDSLPRPSLHVRVPARLPVETLCRALGRGGRGLVGAFALFAFLALGAPRCPAVEETGKVIEKLVAEVDKHLSALEAISDKQAGEKERLKSELDLQFARYEQAREGPEKAAVRSQIVNAIARLNSGDRKEVSATLDTVVNVTDALRKLRGAVQGSAQFNPEVLKAQKERMGKFVQNAARMVKALEAAEGDKADGKRTVALKNSLTMLYRQLNDPVTAAGGSLASINDTLTTLEGVAVQLHVLEAMLENERTMLLAATHAQTVDLALLRLTRARLGTDTVAEIPTRKQQDVVDRMRRAWKPLGETGSTFTGGGDAQDKDTFDIIVSGDRPEPQTIP